MRKQLLIFMVCVFCTSFGWVNAQYVFQWNPVAGTVYGDPLPINNPLDVFIKIGTDLPDGVFDEEDAALQMNGGVWYSVDCQWIEAYEEYQINATYPVFAAESDTNRLVLRIKEIETGTYVYSTSDYYYSRPQLEVQFVQGAAYDPEAPLVIDQNLPFMFQLVSWAPDYFRDSKDLIGDKRIKGLHISHTEDFADYNAITVTSENFVEFSCNLFDYYSLNDDFSYGHNTVYFRAVGEGNDFSSVVAVAFFIFDFQFPQAAFCKYDTLIPLSGVPSGGRFSGECIVDGTNCFNPSLAVGASTLVTYEFRLLGVDFSRSVRVELHELPVFNVVGPFQVCGFEHGAVYSVQGDPGLQLTWYPDTSVVLETAVLSDGSLFVDWAGEGHGSVAVKAENANGCTVTQRQIVDIGVRKAPRDSADVILNDRMLLCSDTSVSFYYWYNAADGKFLARTSKNYYALNFTPSTADSFYVLTAFDTLGCVTHSRFSKPEQKNKHQAWSESGELSVYPNPSSGHFWVDIPPTDETTLQLMICSCDNRAKFVIMLSTTAAGERYPLDLTGLDSGVYYLRLSGKELYRNQKVIISK
ncbi:MAG TPA: T9SS type A sorting domain-containing protein [Bacteroidales bacterium]|nr:T9SS type A sorting domain-containing protein [Bacteroidales bacterium]